MPNLNGEEEKKSGFPTPNLSRKISRCRKESIDDMSLQSSFLDKFNRSQCKTMRNSVLYAPIAVCIKTKIPDVKPIENILDGNLTN
jgi:hypothetical protein